MMLNVFLIPPLLLLSIHFINVRICIHLVVVKVEIKTEIILFGSKKHLAELNIKSLSVAGTDVSVAFEPVRNLGAMFDSQLIMAPHVKSVVKKSSFHLRNIGKARRVLTEDATKTVMQSLVMSRLDYCNALLTGIQQDLIAKLQRLQNSAARIVSRTRKYEHITPVLIKLHWLRIKFRIQFKVLLLVYKALNGLAPKNIKELLVPYKPRRHLRSEAKGLLDEPRTRLKGPVLVYYTNYPFFSSFMNLTKILMIM